jgi:hypothetical protein
LCACSLAQAQVWSPDGLWLAYTSSRTGPGDDDRLLDALLCRTSEEQAIDPWSANRTGGSRLWATRIDTEESVALDEQAEGWLTEPAWSSDGRALAYGRVVGTAREGRRFELVVRDAIERSRVLKSCEWTVPTGGDEGRAAWSVTWSPDGALLTLPVPAPDGMGLAVVHADNGEMTRRLPGALLPRWAPNGRALAFLLDYAGDASQIAGTGVWMRETDELILTPQPPAAVLGTVGAPAWRDDGRVLMFAATRAANPSVRIEQLLVGTLSIETRKPLSSSNAVIPADAEPSALRAFQVVLDPQGDGLFTSHSLRGRNSMLSWFRGGSGAVFRQFSPFDYRSPLVALSVSPRPGLRRLAMRVAGPTGVSPPVLFDPETEVFRPLAPDAAAAACWQQVLARGILDLATEPTQRGINLEAMLSNRPTRFPLPGELPVDHPTLVRMRLLGAEIASLQQRREGSAGNPSAQGRPVWLLVAALATGDAASALDDLDRLESAATDRPTRWRLHGLRAQILLGQGQLARASAIVEHLRAVLNRSGQNIEEMAGRIELAEPSVPGGLTWVERLHDCLVDLASGRNAAEMDSTTPMGFPPMGFPGELPLVEPDIMPQAPPEPQPPPDAMFPARRRRLR